MMNTQYYQQDQQVQQVQQNQQDDDELMDTIEEIKVNIGTLATMEQLDRVEKSIQILSKRFEEFITTNFAEAAKHASETIVNSIPQKKNRGKKQVVQEPNVDIQLPQQMQQMPQLQQPQQTQQQFNIDTPNSQINQTLPLFIPLSTTSTSLSNGVILPPTNKPKTIIASTYFNQLFTKTQQQLQDALIFINNDSIKNNGSGIQDTFESIYEQWCSKDDKGKKEFTKQLYNKFDAKTKNSVKTLQKNESSVFST